VVNVLEIDKIMRGLSKPINKKDKKKKSILDLDNIFPRQINKDSSSGDLLKDTKRLLTKNKHDKVIIHNHYYQVPPTSNLTSNKLITLNGEDDKLTQPKPRKKLVWEKTLQSIYRSDKDD
jgi:hypothetical protein